VNQSDQPLLLQRFAFSLRLTVSATIVSQGSDRISDANLNPGATSRILDEPAASEFGQPGPDLSTSATAMWLLLPDGARGTTDRHSLLRFRGRVLYQMSDAALQK